MKQAVQPWIRGGIGVLCAVVMAAGAAALVLCGAEWDALPGQPDTRTAVTSSDNPKNMLPDFTVSSPNGTLALTLLPDENGALFYKVEQRVDGANYPVLEPSPIGLTADKCDFSEGLTFVSQSPVASHDETYTSSSGKRKVTRNVYRETTWSFVKDGFNFDVTARLYDDGFAYRFSVDSLDGTVKTLTVQEETCGFVLPEGGNVLAQRVTTLKKAFNYENMYDSGTVAEFSRAQSPYVCFPTLVCPKDGGEEGGCVLLTEAALYGDSYRGSLLKPMGGNGFRLCAAPQVSGKEPTVITTGFTSPWRCGIVGSPGEIVESNLIESLCPPPEGNYDWVVPGATAWTWLSKGFMGQRTQRTLRDTIDLAAEMGWKYVILDEGWQPDSQRKGRAYDGYFSYFDNIVNYADQKGVGLIVWVKYVDLDTPEEREILREWAAKGIKGIKADFFDNEDQKTVADYKAIYEICAECHLLVNCHGANKPTGERRTYPHVINREAVRGEEFGALFVKEAVCWAYTRAVVGPIDITPRLYPTGAKGTHTTLGAQMACAVLFESGMPCMAGDAEDYRRFGAAGFYRDLPAAWDETVFLDGKPGEYVTLARRTGDVWYAASLTYSARSGQTLSLTFLGDGSYEAVVYRGDGAKEADCVTQTVTRSDTLTFDLPAESGYVVRFKPL